jgi:hypothetical protein
LQADTCTGTSLGPRKSCTVTVAYQPGTGGGTDTGTLTAAGIKAGATASLQLTGTVPDTVTMTSPVDQASTVGDTVSLQMTATDSASGQTLKWSATGLPAGLSIDSAKGVITGSPTTAGSSSVTVTATDGTNASGSASFTWTVNPATAPPAPDIQISPGTLSGTSSGGVNFYDYSFGPVTSPAVTFTVTNTGTGPTATLALAGGNGNASARSPVTRAPGRRWFPAAPARSP